MEELTPFENKVKELAKAVRECEDITHWLTFDWDGKSLMNLYFWTLLPDWSRPNPPLIAPLPGKDDNAWGTLATGVFCQEALARAEKWHVSNCADLAKRIVEDEKPVIREYEIKLAIFQEITSNKEASAAMPGLSKSEMQVFVFNKLQQTSLADLEKMAPGVAASVDRDFDQLCAMHSRQLDKDLARLFGGEALPEPSKLYAYDVLRKLPALYAKKDAATFNSSLATYLAQVESRPPTGVKPWRLSWEGFYNRLAPYYNATACYIIGFLISVLAWIGAGQFLNRLASSVLFGGSLVQLLGIVLSVGISGRPPVTGLYSSFVVVTFGVVQLFLWVEFFARFGLGNLLASLMGMAGLLWAWNIALGTPDTFSVLVAVLDTNFWLSTHVICVSIGYMSTLGAGLLGLAYMFGAVFTPLFNESTRATITRLIYGVTCFALLFSFVGTVLGGLWADDSWGRFWGWDPKENGAMMIVLWNAVLLHARWSGMARQRGLAALAVLSNIVVTWSWEGVNQLGVGLHSYALSDVSKFHMLLAFWASQLVIASLVFLPTQRWFHGREPQTA